MEEWLQPNRSALFRNIAQMHNVRWLSITTHSCLNHPIDEWPSEMEIADKSTAAPLDSTTIVLRRLLTLHLNFPFHPPLLKQHGLERFLSVVRMPNLRRLHITIASFGQGACSSWKAFVAALGTLQPYPLETLKVCWFWPRGLEGLPLWVR